MRAASHLVAGVLAVGLLAASADTARAQAPNPWRGRFEAGAGATIVGSSALGGTTAVETRNQVGPGDPFVLFRAETSIESARGFSGTLAFRLSPRVSVEGSVRYDRPSLAVRISGDAEDARVAGRVRGDLTELGVDLSLVFHLTRFAFASGRARPFVLGGAGFLRQLHEDRLLSVDSITGHAGGGLEYLLSSRPRGVFKGVALRGQAGLVFGAGGIEVAESVRRRPVATGGVLVLF